MKNKFDTLLKKTNIKGVEQLIKKLEISGFYHAPASTSKNKHSAKDQGLLEHSLNVYDTAIIMYNLFKNELAYTESDIIIASLLHDVGKAGAFGENYYTENILKSGKQSESKPYEVNKIISSAQHQDTSIMVISKYIDLTYDQFIAIKYHNGLYTPDGRSIIGKETPLYLLIHFADMWASRVIE